MTDPFRAQPGDPSLVRHQMLHCLACGRPQDSASVPGPGPMLQRPVDGDAHSFWAGRASE